MVLCIPHALLALAVIGHASAAPSSSPSQTCGKVQYDFPSGTGKNDSRVEAVKQAYRREWQQYSKYAFPNDDLLPVTHNYTNDLFGWGATVVDGIDTAIVMGLTDIVEQQLKHIASVDFTKSAYLVDFFDVNIRYIGGLLSAHDLIKSGLFPGSYDEKLVEALLSQAKSLATAISPVFDTVTGLPAANLNFSTHTNTAQAGTMILEYYRLSDLTGDESFRQHAQKAEEYLISPSPTPVFPGLYLIKTYVYNPDDELARKLKEFWITTAESSIDHIALHPYHRPELTFLSQMDTNGSIMWTMDDYACFAGGNLLLGGKYLGRPDITELGVKVTDSCHWLYNTTLTGLGPSSIGWYNASNKAYDSSYDTSADSRAEASKYGYFLEDPSYRSYPEPLESIFYAYRITGETRWQDYNWQIFQALNTTRSTSVPYAEITDVNAPGGGQLVNYVSSFYFAEVLKYLYLTFTEPDVVSLDRFVFNTECHPVLIEKPCGSS
ncbi:mannosyl-oligosaccharide alpha-1-2-mannosidase 1B [Penicillium hispanicum]|uniref:mannosyl-oligosaccharide alpha-1-2-mannosidase 1B n=1 Tax=Penicillium hispanicum TaxID=1080232 RepID=UPI0025405A49|nr:mannosyl-oligosaccharide alpha-1-2-mannosidase 1B [Penicillium hispanicum]KAJ5574023.1 mannosyl-oligosaccharide alpha-1-2-mannosidase 1B [Penicillium hispanicum]